MNRALVKVTGTKLPKDLKDFFGDPPLVGNEKAADYERFFSAVADAVRPRDPIGWMFTRDVVDISWEMRRERKVKADIIKAAEIDVVHDLLQSFKKFVLDDDRTESRLWGTDPKERRRIDKILLDKGYTGEAILALAFMREAGNIDAIDRRIASYELRRMAALREYEQHDEQLARRLKSASADVIEGEFTDLVEGT